MIIGTWSIITLRGVGLFHDLTMLLNLYIWEIIGLAETILENSGELLTDEGRKIIYSGQQQFHQKDPINLTIIHIHAPTSNYEDDIEIEEFYMEI